MCELEHRARAFARARNVLTLLYIIAATAAGGVLSVAAAGIIAFRVLGTLVQRIGREGASVPLADELEAVCRRAGIVLQHRHHLVDQLGALCQELTSSLTDLAEDDSWAKGQCDAMRVKLDEGLTARGVRAVSELLRDTRERQGTLRAEREKAREALKTLINRMLSELGELGSQTGRFHESVGRYADAAVACGQAIALAQVLDEMGDDVDGVAVVALDHPAVREAGAVVSESTDGRAALLLARLAGLAPPAVSIVPLFETSDARYQWLNGLVTVACGRRIEGGIRYTVFAIG